MKREMPDKWINASEKTDVPSARKESLKKKNKRLALLRGALLILCCVILITGLLLVVLPLFRIQRIEVKGNSYHTNEEIIEIAQIEVGQESLQVNVQDIVDRIRKSDIGQYFSKVSAKMISPFQIRIEVVEKNGLSAVEHEGSYYTFDESFTVLEKCDRIESVEKFLLVKLPKTSTLSVGSQIEFATDADMSYFTDFVSILASTGLMPYVTELDCETKYDVSFTLGNTCRIEFGKAEELGQKLQLAQGVLLELKVEDGYFATVNVSNPQRPTFRAEAI